MNKYTTFFGFLSIIVFSFTQVFAMHCEFDSANGFFFTQDEWDFQLHVKSTLDQGVIEVKDIESMVFPHKIEIYESQSEARGYPLGFTTLLSVLVLTIDLPISSVFFLFGLFLTTFLISVIFNFANKLYPNTPVPLIACLLAILVPSQGTSHGPLYLTPSTLSSIFLILIVFQFIKNDNFNYYIIVLLSIIIFTMHRASTNILVLVMLLSLVHEKYRSHSLCIFLGTVLGVMINISLMGLDSLSKSYSLPVNINGYLVILSFFLSPIIYYIFLKKIFPYVYYNVKLIKYSINILPVYMAVIFGILFFIVYYAYTSDYSIGYYWNYTNFGYVIYTILTIGIITPIAIYCGFFSSLRIIHFLVTLTLVLLGINFLYLLDKTPENLSVYTRLAVYASLFYPLFSAKYIVDYISADVKIFRTKIKVVKAAIIVSLLISLLFNINQYYNPINPVMNSKGDWDLITYEIAPYIDKHTSDEEPIIIVGDSRLTRLATYLDSTEVIYYQTNSVSPYDDYDLRVGLGFNWYMDAHIPNLVLVPKEGIDKISWTKIDEGHMSPSYSSDRFSTPGLYSYFKTFENEDSIIYLRVGS